MQANGVHHPGDIVGGQSGTLGAGQPPLHALRGQGSRVAAEVVRGDLGAGLRQRIGRDLGLARRGGTRLTDPQQSARGGIVPVRDEDLGLLVGGAATRPGESSAVRGEHGETVEALAVRDPQRLALPRGIDQIELEVAVAVGVVGEDHIVAGGVEIGRPGHDAEARDAALIAAVRAHGPDLGHMPGGLETPPDDAAAVGAEEGAAVVAQSVRQAPDVSTVGIHDVEVHEHGRVLLEHRALVLAERVGPVGVPVGGKDDLRAVRGPAPLRVVARGIREPAQDLALGVGLVDVVVLIERPGIAAGLAGRPLVDLLLLLGEGLWIRVGGGEQEPLPGGMDPGAGGLADAGRDQRGVAALQVHEIDLVEGVAGLPLALEDHLRPVGTEIALARAGALEDQLAGVGEELRTRARAAPARRRPEARRG